ncbi:MULTISPECIES: VOC family protein [Streptomycetaceae]|uniref:Putative hydroxylase/glyoxylase n=1 Tax=Streptantibioticus cattleyicolor (strain ATCC 35852 / DSM 46488 / JCM 4925 / NBRC 14057 / NRRL 8057) TaxID=1003195 RepID=F8JT05_STREN|nr:MULTISPECIES: VOC family protein [Streptomycetaceae]AEW98105.1 putative hydroxylase/glyoxylase [Streptantibioticus cattleyicolor NRRL 8057 = DSM 46488]MYS62497.1 VOC family protein [Streptomyces sp. SID5468]CCB78420.1 putative hydroxylase/glyoxylase [Streptantibioticus cattleyicolor NRRL 8057 = DSM 46488]
MSYMSPGQVVWFEIGTTGPDAITGFYGPLLGWTFEVDPDSSIDGRTYTRILAPGAPWPMGAVQQGDTGEEAINLSILSADVPADVDKLTGLGATVVVPATPVGDVTVFARVRDPRGNLLSLFSQSTSRRFEERITGTRRYMEQAAFTPKPGSMAWFEIGTTDVKATTDFYTAGFGWRFENDQADGTSHSTVFGPGAKWPSGSLRDHSGQGAAGADYVMSCFLVTDVAATTARAERAGARLEHGPRTSPGGLVSCRLIDPRGNRFGVFSRPTGDQAS